MSACFDEERFAALLGLAGLATALELTQRLDEDLSMVGLALTDAVDRCDHPTLQAQSHILLSIAGTIGATRLFQLAQDLNAMMRDAATAGASAVVTEIGRELREVIARVKSTQSDLTRAS